MVADTQPGYSLLGNVLRDETVWPQMVFHVTGRLSTNPDPSSGITIRVDRFVSFVEEVAGNGGAHIIGERHIAAALASSHAETLRQLSLDAHVVFARTQEVELGPEFAPQHISDRWHGLIDTSIVIECKDIWSIDWQSETANRHVTIWASIGLLEEVDNQAYYHRSERVQRRAVVFATWFRQHFAQIMTTEGYEMSRGVRFRVWEVPVGVAPPDNHHLSTAEMLLDKNVPVRILTVDTAMVTHAQVRGLEVHLLSNDAFNPESPRRA